MRNLALVFGFVMLSTLVSSASFAQTLSCRSSGRDVRGIQATILSNSALKHIVIDDRNSGTLPAYDEIVTSDRRYQPRKYRNSNRFYFGDSTGSCAYTIILPKNLAQLPIGATFQAPFTWAWDGGERPEAFFMNCRISR